MTSVVFLFGLGLSFRRYVRSDEPALMKIERLEFDPVRLHVTDFCSFDCDGSAQNQTARARNHERDDQAFPDHKRKRRHEGETAFADLKRLPHLVLTASQNTDRAIEHAARTAPGVSS